jgi:tetratricopeptide (TPR) repeat protein
LIRGAIRLDPDFASAYIILAYTLHNQRRPAREFMPPAERAMDLAGNATQREAYFIRASYYAFTGDREKMFAAYDALLRLYPDHYWANNNMANLLPQAAAVPYAVRCAQLRPRNAARSFRAAMDLINGANKPDEAEPYVERVVALTADSSFDPRAGGEIAWARLWQAHRDWTAGKLDEAKAELDRWAAKLPGMREGEDYWMRQYLIRGYRTLGMARRAMELAPPTEFPITRKYFQGLDAYFVGDADRARRNFTADSWQIQDTADLWRDPLRVAALARLGWTDKAGAILASFRKRPSEDPMRRRPSLVEARMEAEMPLAAGRFREAALLLEAKAFGPRISVGERGFEGYGSSYFLAAQALSIAYRKLGRTEDAVAILKQALAERLRSYPNGTETWMDTQLRLARLDRELGKTAEAERLEAQLRGLMKFADPDFWALRRLKEQSGSPTASQSPP